MKKCPNCNNENPNGNLFCWKCGYDLAKVPSALPASPVQTLHAELAKQTSQPIQPVKKKKGTGCLISTIILLAVFGIAWLIVRPGVFTIQPIGALPEGVTFIYYSRGPEMPLFSSPDGLCLKIQGGVSLLCRMSALAAVTNLTDRIIIRLPYIRWAYLLSTGGMEFEQ